MLQVRADTRKVNQSLGELSNNIRDMSAVFREIGEYVLTETSIRFDRGVDPDGRPWIPSKRAKRDGGKTLVDKAILRQSVNYKASDDSVEIGVGRFPLYARIHQMGGMAGRGRRAKIPARPYLGINTDDEKEVIDIITNFLRSI